MASTTPYMVFVIGTKTMGISKDLLQNAQKSLRVINGVACNLTAPIQYNPDDKEASDQQLIEWADSYDVEKTLAADVSPSDPLYQGIDFVATLENMAFNEMEDNDYIVLVTTSEGGIAPAHDFAVALLQKENLAVPFYPKNCPKLPLYPHLKEMAQSFIYTGSEDNDIPATPHDAASQQIAWAKISDAFPGKGLDLGEDEIKEVEDSGAHVYKAKAEPLDVKKDIKMDISDLNPEERFKARAAMF